MENTRDIRDFIIEKTDEIPEEIILKKAAPPRKVSYSVLIESGCDFVVERKENKGSKRLVVLVSQKQFYIESDNNTKRKLTYTNLWEFLRDLPKEGLKLEEVSWLPLLLPKKMDFSNPLMAVLSDESMVEFLQKEIAYVPEYYFPRCIEIDSDMFEMNSILLGEGLDGNISPLLVGRSSSPFFDIDSYGMGVQGMEGAPGFGQGMPPMNGGMGGPFMGNMNRQIATNSYYLFKNPGSAYMPKVKRPDFTDMFFHGPDDEDICFNNYAESRRYVGMRRWQMVLYGAKLLYSRSPGLYKDMIRLMLKRYGCSIKKLFEERLLKRDTPENLIMRSFQSFILIRAIFGPEWGIRAMERFLVSGTRQALPYEFLLHLLFKAKVKIPHKPEEYYRKVELAWTFKADRFIQYLLETSFEEGFGDDMEGFIARWENVLFYQKVLYGKVKDKYPRNLATVEHKMAFDIRRNKDVLYQRMWEERVKENEDLEFEGDEYRIITAKNNQDLIEESDRQHNCVDGYEGNVLSGRCMILFMRFTDPEKQNKSILTIEVTSEGVINQVKGACNRAPRMKELNFVKEWADEKNLKLNEDEVMLMEW